MWREFRKAGTTVILVDQGYFKETRFHRVSVNAHHPTWYLATAKHGPERWDSFRVPVRPWRKQGDLILIAGGSEKYHRFYDLPHPNIYYKNLIDRLQLTGRPIVYRPKPSWQDAKPISGSVYSHRRGPNYNYLFDSLRKSHVMVTHGSNACYEAMIYGVPSIVLGDGIAKPISSTSLDDIENPRIAPEEERMQLLWNLAWCQFSWGEFIDGTAWRHLRNVIDASRLLHL